MALGTTAGSVATIFVGAGAGAADFATVAAAIAGRVGAGSEGAGDVEADVVEEF